MRIPVAAGASQVAKVEGPARTRRRLRDRASGLVAILACDSDVGAFERKTRRLMFLDAEGRGMKTIHSVATLATVGTRSTGELSVVRIAMAIQTRLKAWMVAGVETSRRVALGAGQALVFADDGKCGVTMSGFGEGRRAPIRHGVARAAVAAIGAVEKLALVLVAVAIQASLVRHRRLEVRIPMTLQTGDVVVLPFQRKFSGAVVEAARSPKAFPGVRAVAVLASRGECAVVGVVMTTGARTE
jgi:hypothetical protein